MNTPARELARGRWHGILAQQGIEDRFLSGNNVSCPFCGGKDRFRFTNHNDEGWWHCNQCGSGDGFVFLENLHGMDFKQCASLVEEIVKLPSVEKMEQPKVDYGEREIRLRRRLQSSVEVTAGDPVYKYLKGRQLELPPNHDNRCRYVEKEPYYKDGGLLGYAPAMVWNILTTDEKLMSAHITYLTKDGGKLAVDKPKKMMPVCQPKRDDVSVIIPLSDMDATGRLYITEGIENGLAVYKMTGGCVWAVITAGGMERFTPPPQIKQLIICGDNDKSFTGQKSAYALAHRLQMDDNIKAQIAVRIPDRAGIDYNDELIEKSIKETFDKPATS